ncbi:MAG: hypothetical protein NVSMB33_01040 [Ktedonobacteraceae bacterium]
MHTSSPSSDKYNSLPDAEPTQRVVGNGLLSKADEDATVRVSSLLPSYLYVDEPNDEPDTDATHRVSSRLLSSIYMQAAQKEAINLSTSQELPTLHVLSSSSNKLQPITPKRPKKPSKKKVFVQVSCGLGLVLLLTLLVSTIMVYRGSDTHAQLQAGLSKSQLDAAITSAQSLGVPASYLQPILKQEQQLSSSSAPFTVFINQPVTTYYQTQVKRYHLLLLQIPAVVTAATEQVQLQAQQDMQNFQTALSRANTQNIASTRTFAQQFSQEQLLLEQAQSPKDYLAISSAARQSTLSLSLMEATFSQLTDFQATIGRLKAAHLDVTAMQAEYQNDLQSFNNATLPFEFQNVSTQINVQYQQVVVNSVQAFPYVSITKLNELEKQINFLKTYGVDASYYQARLNDDQVTMEKASTVYDDLLFFKQIDTDIASMQNDLVRGEARYLVHQYHREVDAWAKAHAYHDNYDGKNYALNNGYMQAGIGAGLDNDLASATLTTDFETMIDEANNALFNLHMLESDYSDQTPYNHIHATDRQVLSHYKLEDRQVLMVSLVEQAMRVYQNGKLLNSYHVTTGRQELPSLPGVWSVLDRKSPIIFKAAEPKGSPYWFPDTPISYAILYHWGGYFVHDAPWRADFGPGTQFPHQDASGTTAYNFDGSHGCINLAESDAGWVYKHTDWNTAIVIY